MRISGNEHSSVILSQTEELKVKNGGPKVPETSCSKPKGMV